MFYPVLKFLIENRILDVSSKDVEESIDEMKVVTDSITKTSNRNEALTFARRLVPRKKPMFPLLYSSVWTRAVGLRTRQSMNENAKIHAFNGEIPELCHNEIVGWDSKTSKIKGLSSVHTPGDVMAILLRLGNDDTNEIRTRFDIVAEIIDKAKGKVLEAPYSGRSYLSRIMAQLLFLDYVTYYMATLRGIDPIKTPSIDLLKKQLANKLNFISQI
jgi:glucose/mannose-6-phosphate isomerase